MYETPWNQFIQIDFQVDSISSPYSDQIDVSHHFVLHFFSPSGIDYKTTIILLDGKRVKLQLW